MFTHMRVHANDFGQARSDAEFQNGEESPHAGRLKEDAPLLRKNRGMTMLKKESTKWLLLYFS